jgi:hypothetical protein
MVVVRDASVVATARALGPRSPDSRLTADPSCRPLPGLANQRSRAHATHR